MMLRHSNAMAYRSWRGTVAVGRNAAGQNFLGSNKRRSSFSSLAPSQRLGRTLYRQLLRWCQETGDDIPLSNVVPPVTLKPPHVDGTALAQLAAGDDSQWTHVASLLPPKSQVESHQMTIPIHRASDARQMFRAVYRLNQVGLADSDALKERTSVAFDALKSLNELTQGLQDMRAQREKHLDRTGVIYRIGQVVQHKSERWRGVIVGWQPVKQKSGGQRPTSLTTKPYSSVEEEEEGSSQDGPAEGKSLEHDDVQYSVCLDFGDAHLLGGWGKLNEYAGRPSVIQSDLEPVKDESLLRIRTNWIPNYFGRFDPVKNCFVPDETRAFEYPLDMEPNISTTRNEHADSFSRRRDELGEQVISGVQEFAAMLQRCVSEEASGLNILADYHARFQALSRGDVKSTRDTLSSKDLTAGDIAELHLRNLLNIDLELSEILWSRAIAERNADKIRFALGDIVHHKKFGFRGVVVGWDPEPAVDVSRWDGLADIESPSELPFYHIIPDSNDCVKAFGDERPFRYVCDANLERCPPNRTVLDVDLDPGWERNVSEGRYKPPEELQLKYFEDTGDDGATASCLSWIKSMITRLHLAMRHPEAEPERDLSSLATKLSLDNLFELLPLSDSKDGASVVEETIKEVWKAHRDQRLRQILDTGIADLMRGKKELALISFMKIVDEDPEYAEAFNKISTCQYMMGDMQASLESAQRTLVLEPRHFQAMNGLGLIHYETRRFRMAEVAFRRSLSIDPWSAVSSRLAACLDLLGDLAVEEDQGAQEGTAPYQSKDSS